MRCVCHKEAARICFVSSVFSSTVSDLNDIIHTSTDWNKHFIMISDVKRRASVLLEA